MTPGTWHLTPDMVGGKNSLKNLVPKVSRFGIDRVVKILNQSISQLISNRGDCRTVPATHYS